MTPRVDFLRHAVVLVNAAELRLMRRALWRRLIPYTPRHEALGASVRARLTKECGPSWTLVLLDGKPLCQLAWGLICTEDDMHLTITESIHEPT